MNKEHLGGCVITNDIGTFAPQVWDKIIQLYSPKSVIDVGCGAGHSLKYFLDKGLTGLGVEGYVDAINRSPVKSFIVEHDYTLGPYIPSTNFDLAWCCEFVEHVEEKYLNNFMDTFCCCNVVAMTHAVPGQPGYHHVNCQTSQYWINIFKSYNFEYLEKDSLLLRQCLFNVDGSWTENGSHVRNTLMIFKRK
jgi:SAM-dependent methyltransferase